MPSFELLDPVDGTPIPCDLAHVGKHFGEYCDCGKQYVK